MTITTTSPRGRALNARPSKEIEGIVAAWRDQEVADEISAFKSNAPRRLHMKWFPIAISEAARRGLPLNLGC